MAVIRATAPPRRTSRHSHQNESCGCSRAHRTATRTSHAVTATATSVAMTRTPYDQMIAHARGTCKRRNDYMGMADGEIVFKTKIDDSGVDKGLKGISQKLKALGSNSSLKGIAGLGSAVTGVVSAFNLAREAIGKVADGLKELSSLAITQENAEARLAAAAKNNPYLDSYSVSKLKAYAGELQSIGEVGDEALLPLMAELAAAGRSYSEIQSIMSAALDASASGMISMEAAVQSLNMSYSGSVGSLGKLLPNLKNLTEEELRSGKAIEEVKKAYGGMAQATANTGVQLSNSFGDLKEKLGGLLNKVIVPLQKGLLIVADAANALWDKLSNIISGGEDAQATTLDSKLIKAQYELETLQEQLAETEGRYRDAAAAQADYANEIAEAEEKLARAREKGNRTAITLYETQIRLLKEQAAANKSNADAIDDLVERRDEETAAIRQNIEEKQEEIKAIQDEIKANKIAEQIEKEVAARDKLRAEYDATIAAKQKEIALRRSAGEEISAEAEAQEMYNAAFAAYIKMMSDPAFSGNSGNYAHEVDARKDIANWGMVAGGADAAEQLKAFESELSRAVDEANGIARNQYDATLAALDAEYEAVVSNKYLEEEEKLRIEREYAEKRAEISAAKDKAEKDRLTEKIDGMSSSNESYWSAYKRKTEEIARLEKEIDESTVLTHEEKEAAKTRLSEAAAQARKELAAGVAAEIKGYTDQAVSIMNDAANLMLDTVKNKATAEQATLELMYRKGEISEEEYNEKITESKKKAAKEQYKIQMFQWSASILQATANIAQGITQAIAQGGIAGLVTGAIVGAAGAVQIASIIASKPVPPSFAAGGIVPGNSYSGDRVRANVNSGEMILNAAQQRALWDVANGRGAGGGTSIVIHNSASNVVRAKPQVTKDQVEIMIDARVTEGLRSGRYGTALNQAQQGMGGEFYGI